MFAQQLSGKAGRKTGIVSTRSRGAKKSRSPTPHSGSFTQRPTTPDTEQKRRGMVVSEGHQFSVYVRRVHQLLGRSEPDPSTRQ